MTFYDKIKHPYTSTFYVASTTTNQEATELIHCVEALSICVLGKYKIGYDEFLISDYLHKLKNISPYSMGTSKWRIVAYTENHKVTSFSIPGRNPDLMTQRKTVELEHSAWKTFLTQFRKLCLAKTGESLQERIEVEVSNGTWPPKGAKRR